MFKLTVYKKVNISRNLLVVLFVVCLLAVGGKMVAAHEKITTYKEAMRFYQSGKMIAAEQKFRAARWNPAVTDHNQEMDLILAVLSPIRTEMENLDEKAADYYKEKKLNQLVKTYERWQANKEKWLAGTEIQTDMYQEMVAENKLDKDLNSYFSSMKKTLYGKLARNKANESSGEEVVFADLNQIPAEYYGGDQAKATEIEDSFLKYYAMKLDKLKADGMVAAIVEEGNRQFSMLKQFSFDSGWLTETLDAHLLSVLTSAVDKEEYGSFAEQASSTLKLEGNMGVAKVFPFIKKSKVEILAKAKKLVVMNKYEDAIKMYEALQPLEDTTTLIASANLDWDKFEPIRVLKRQYPEKDFPYVVNAHNKWGAESVVAAITKDGAIYFGRLNGEEPMAVTEGKLNEERAPTINKLTFDSGDLSTADKPVLFIDAKSETRAHHYFAYEVRVNSIEKILDIEADNLTVESQNRLLADNPVGEGEGKSAYFEPFGDGVYQFTEIKVDYDDISVADIKNFPGKKVRFSTNVELPQNGGALAVVSETYNYDTYQYEKSYLLLKSQAGISLGYSTIIGIVSGVETVTVDGQQVEVPVVQVEKQE